MAPVKLRLDAANADHDGTKETIATMELVGTQIVVYGETPNDPMLQRLAEAQARGISIIAHTYTMRRHLERLDFTICIE